MNMVNPEKYYKATIGNKPSALIRKFFMFNYDKKIQGNSALDLGCGVGNDTEFLLSKGFKVTAVDCEETTKNIFENRDMKSDNLNIIIDDFSKTELPRVDLVLANFSMQFVNDNFQEFIENLLNKNIISQGFFVGNFLGKEDDWNKTRTTVSKEDLMNYFKNYEILYFSEEKYYRDSVSMKNKYWHVYTIMAQRKN